MIIKIFNGILFYVGWSLCVIGAAQGWSNLGAVITFLFALLSLSLVKERVKEFVLMFIILTLGFVIDTTLIQSGLIVFAAPNPFYNGIAPLWVLSIYALFSTSINGSLIWLHNQPILAAVFGGGGGLMSYLFGTRVGAATFMIPNMEGAIIIGIVWFFLFPTILLINKQIDLFVKKHPDLEL